MADEQKDRQEAWTYIGQRIWRMSGGVPALSYVWLDAEGKERGFKKNIARFARPGGRFRVTLAGDSSVYVGGEKEPQFLGMHEDEEAVAAWRAAELADQAKRRRLKAAKNDMSHDRLAEVLAPLANEYQRRDATGRRALIATVIEYMTTGRLA